MDTELLLEIREKEGKDYGRRTRTSPNIEGELSESHRGDTEGTRSIESRETSVSTGEATHTGPDSVIGYTGRKPIGGDTRVDNPQGNTDTFKSGIPELANVATGEPQTGTRRKSSRVKQNVATMLIGDGSTKKKKPKGKPLTAGEAEKLRETLLTGYDRLYKLYDQILSAVIRGHEDIRIWQLSEEEVESVVSYKLKRAQKSPLIAAEVKAVAESMLTIEYYYIHLTKGYSMFVLIKDTGVSLT